MEILQLDVSGRMAHFRKYYANNTAMSFSIPPRTTIIGMLAGMLGRPRDSYYEEFASVHIRIGIRVMHPIKKTFHRVNLLRVTGQNDFSGAKGRIQTPFEIVSGLNISRDEVVYRIYVSCTDAGQATFNELRQIILNRQQTYALTFGTANFTASIRSGIVIDDNQISILQQKSFVTIHSAMPSEAVDTLDFDRETTTDTLQSIEEELMPADFIANANRELSRMNRVLFSTTATGIRVKLNRGFYALTQGDIVQHILFLE